MKKNIFKISAILAAAAMLFAGCQQEELSTDQFALGDNDIALSAFGPNPVYRGGTLTIVGANLDKVAEVNIPGIDPITDITVETGGTPSKITVTIPVEGPEVGLITLKSKSGKTVSSAVELTYTEPIVFTSFSPASAMPGDEITITGDYLNLIQEVVFGGDAISNDIVSQSRHELKIVVPEHAISGKISLGDADQIENPDAFANLYPSENGLSIGNPTITGISASNYKAGATLTVKGTYLCMIKSVEFQNASVTDFSVSEDWKTLTLAIPGEAQDGDVKGVSYAAVDVAAGTVTLVKPGSLTTSPSPVKAGSELTISGSDLDLVTGLSFAGAGAVEFSLSGGAIKATVPAKATEGNATLSIANGGTFDVAYTLVHPTVTGIDPLTITAGDVIKVSGTDLDLITGVTLGGKEEAFELKDGSIEITTAATSVAGKIVLKLANGETVEPGEDITVNYDSFIVVNEMPAAEHIGATVTLKGTNFMMIDRIYIGDAKVTQYLKRTDEEISFVMPYNKVGSYSITFELMSGDKEICPTPIEVLLEINRIVAWEGKTQITWGDGGRVLVPASKFLGVTPGTVMRLYYTQVDQQWDQAQVNYGDWSVINFNGAGGTNFNGTLVPTDVYGWFTDGILDRCTEVVLTKEILDNIEAKKGDAEGQSELGIIIQGSGLTFTLIEILQEIPQERTLWEGKTQITWGEGGRVLIPASKFEGLAAGAEMSLYYTQVDQQWDQAQFNYGDWSGIDFNGAGGTTFNQTLVPTDVYGWFTDGILDRCTKVILTQEILDNIQAKKGSAEEQDNIGIIIQGSGLTFTKIVAL